MLGLIFLPLIPRLCCAKECLVIWRAFRANFDIFFAYSIAYLMLTPGLDMNTGCWRWSHLEMIVVW